MLDLSRPIDRKSAAYVHFGHTESEITWERSDKADNLRDTAVIWLGHYASTKPGSLKCITN